MNLLPWRVRKVISDRLPLVYHVVGNAGTSGNNAAHWNDWLGRTWDERDWPTKTARIRKLTQPTDAILDVGCGTGSILRSLYGDDYRDLHGMEISDYAIHRLRREGITMWEGRLPELTLPDGRFDVVIASQVLEHIIRRKRFASEIARVLKPLGRAFIFVPDDCLGPIDESEHVIKYTSDSLRVFLEKTFRVISIESMRDTNYRVPLLFAQVTRRGQ